MKKLISVILVIAMLFAFTACTITGDNNDANKSQNADADLYAEYTAVPYAVGDEIYEEYIELIEGEDLSELKIGMILVGDEEEGYSLAHMTGIEKMCDLFGIDKETQLVYKKNIGESDECLDAAKELVDDDCTIIFANSFGHEAYILKAAELYPEVQFCHATGFQAASSGLENVCNYFNNVYESRYISGIYAGYKLVEMMEENPETVVDGKITIGYVGAYPYAEVVSGYTAFYLGVNSVLTAEAEEAEDVEDAEDAEDAEDVEDAEEPAESEEVVESEDAEPVEDEDKKADEDEDEKADEDEDEKADDKEEAAEPVKLEMKVKFTGSWADQALENDAANALIAEGCVLISQHADTTGAASACEAEGVYDVGYNVTMTEAAPNYAITSATLNWASYYSYAVANFVAGNELEVDWSEGYATGAVKITEVNKAAFHKAETYNKAVEAANEAIEGIIDGTLHVFDISTWTVEGKTITSTKKKAYKDMYHGVQYIMEDNNGVKYFAESTIASAPAFAFDIDGIVKLTDVD